MDYSIILEYSAILVAVGSIVGVRLQKATIDTLKENNQAQGEQIAILKSETMSCREDHLTSQGQIAELKGQLADFRDLPLKQIQSTQADILETQKKIVELLTRIENNQPDRIATARAVRQVKEDLRDK